MMRFYLIALLLLLVSWSSDAHNSTEPIDPMWANATKQRSALSKWVAKNIEQNVAETPKGEATKKTRIYKQFVRIEKNKPVYRILEISPPSNDGSEADQNVDFGAMFLPLENKIFSNAIAMQRKENQALNGKTLAVFELSKVGLTLKYWVDPETGELVQRVFQGSMSFAMSGTMTTMYNTGSGTLNLPNHATTKISISIPFQKAEIGMTDTYLNWIELP